MRMRSPHSRRSWPDLVVDPSDPRTPRIRERRQIFESPYQTLYRVEADFGAFEKTYVVSDLGAHAGIVAVVDGRVLLVRQQRLLIDGLSWEVPGGAVGDGETPGQAAARECLEETGIRCLELEPLLTFQLSLDIIHNPSHLFVSRQVQTEAPGPVDVSEVAHVEWVELDRCIRMIFSGDIVDTFSIVALLAYRAMLAERDAEFTAV